MTVENFVQRYSNGRPAIDRLVIINLTIVSKISYNKFLVKEHSTVDMMRLDIKKKRF